MYIEFLVIFLTVFSNSVEVGIQELNHENDSGIKRFLGILVCGLKNIAKIGRIFRFNSLFFRDPDEKLDKFKFTPKERRFLSKLAQLAQQTYSIGDFNDIKVENTGINSLSDRKILDHLSNENNISVSDEKTAFITNSLKGIVFTSETTTAIAFKGTSLTFLGIDSSNTSKKDKFFDNVVFNCDPNLQNMKDILYLEAAQRIYQQMKHRYPQNKIVLTGHSMGAAIASIIGQKNNEYVVAFASPGDKRITKTLNLITNKKETKEPRSMIQNLFYRLDTNIVHIGDCSDAIYRGACNGSIDVCKIAGYNIKTRCHTGRKFCINKNTNFSLLRHPATTIVESFKKTDVDFYEIDQTDCDIKECKKGESKIFLK